MQRPSRLRGRSRCGFFGGSSSGAVIFGYIQDGNSILDGSYFLNGAF